MCPRLTIAFVQSVQWTGLPRKLLPLNYKAIDSHNKTLPIKFTRNVLTVILWFGVSETDGPTHSLKRLVFARILKSLNIFKIWKDGQMNLQINKTINILAHDQKIWQFTSPEVIDFVQNLELHNRIGLTPYLHITRETRKEYFSRSVLSQFWWQITF